MTDLRDLLHQHASVPRRDLEVDAVLARARRRRITNRLAAWLAGLAALGAVAVPVEQALAPAGRGAGEVRTVVPPPGPGPAPPLPSGPSAPKPPRTTTAQGAATPGRPTASAPRSGPVAAQAAPAGPSAAGGAPSSASAPGSDVPAPPVPVRPGRYQYSYSEYGHSLGAASNSGQAPLIVDAPTRTAEGQLQHESYTWDAGGGYTFTVRWDLLYSAAGIHQQHYSRDTVLNGVPYDHEDCTDPAGALVLPVGIRKGDTWHFNQTCADQLNGTSTINVTMTDSGTDQVQVGGQTLSAVDISEYWGQGDIEDPELDPSNGLALADQVSSTSGAGDSYNYSEKLESATPS